MFFKDNLSSDFTKIKGLDSLVNLRVLNLGYNQITDLKPLARLTSLENIYLSNNPITDIEPLEKLPNLKKLYADYTQIPQRALREFKEARERAWKIGKGPYFIIVGII